MTFREALTEGAGILGKAGIGENTLDAWYLLEYVTGVSRALYLADSGRKMEPEQEEEFFSLIRKRADRIPLQHLTGVQEFMGMEFRVNEHVLIPRQDTEVLVETALELWNVYEGTYRAQVLQEQKENALRILDLCTGSGCILISLLKLIESSRTDRKTGKLKEICGMVPVAGTGADISEAALDAARINAEALGVQAEFLKSDLFGNLSGKFHMIVSNPPYIRTTDMKDLQEEVREHDPALALDGGEDGLHFYREIIRQSGDFLYHGGVLLFEIGCDQADEVSLMMKQAGYAGVTVKKDLAGLDRVVFGVYDVDDSLRSKMR